MQRDVIFSCLGLNSLAHKHTHKIKEGKIIKTHAHTHKNAKLPIKPPLST